MVEGAPWPVRGALAQSGLQWVAVDVAELFYELVVIAEVEIVVAFLPEMLDCPTQANFGLEWATFELFGDQASGDALLQGFQGIG